MIVRTAFGHIPSDDEISVRESGKVQAAPGEIRGGS
jgi:hypothetical protein